MLVTMKDVLFPAKKDKYAVGLFNTVNLEMARGVIKVCGRNAFSGNTGNSRSSFSIWTIRGTVIFFDTYG